MKNAAYRDAKVDQLSSKTQNLNGRQVKNAGNATHDQDLTTLSDVKNRIAKIPQYSLPAAKANALGGIKAISAVAHKFLQYIDTFGNPQLAQPAFTDISGTATTAQIPAAVRAPTTQTVTANTGNTVYHNTGTTPKFVSISFDITSYTGAVQILTDASNPPTTEVCKFNQGGWTIFCFWVLPGNYYKFVAGTNTITYQDWVEWN